MLYIELKGTIFEVCQGFAICFVNYNVNNLSERTWTIINASIRRDLEDTIALRVWGTIQRRIFVEKTDFTISEIRRSMFTFRIRNLNHMLLSGLEYRLAQKIARQLICVLQ